MGSVEGDVAEIEGLALNALLGGAVRWLPDQQRLLVRRQLQQALQGARAAQHQHHQLRAGPRHLADDAHLRHAPEQAQAVHAFIRDKLSALDAIIAGQMRILYGGSVNGSNAADLFAREDIDGGLVGGASASLPDIL